MTTPIHLTGASNDLTGRGAGPGVRWRTGRRPSSRPIQHAGAHLLPPHWNSARLAESGRYTAFALIRLNAIPRPLLCSSNTLTSSLNRDSAILTSKVVVLTSTALVLTSTALVRTATPKVPVEPHPHHRRDDNPGPPRPSQGPPHRAAPACATPACARLPAPHLPAHACLRRACLRRASLRDACHATISSHIVSARMKRAPLPGPAGPRHRPAFATLRPRLQCSAVQ